ncbi:MAG TPA: hypothetical protein VN931_07295 [Fibrobacteria bacterium]|nr:hypothetical protein [Fibrobacteria bacterium]
MALFAFVLAGCGGNDKVAGTNDETHTEVAARIYTPGGQTFATGAAVKVVPGDSTQAVAVGTVDSTGLPQTSQVPDGIYTVSVTLDSLVSTIDSVVATGGKLQLAENDTLEASGTLSGVVALQPQDDPATVTVQVLGTENYSNVAENGRFTLTDLPTEKVRLRLVTTLPNYTPTFDTTHATTAAATRIPDTIHMIYTGIPVVTGLAVVNDSATGQLVLSWHPVAYSALLDYLVFRDTAGAIGYSSIPFAATTDSTWRDTASDSTASTQAWRYRVVVRNRSGIAGTWTESVTGVSIPPALRRVDSATWTLVGRGGSTLGTLGSGKMATASLGTGGPSRTFSIESSPDGLLWDSAGTSVPTLDLGQTIEWVSGIGAGKAWCLGNSDIGASVQARIFDGTSWTSTTLDESLWPGSGAILFGSPGHIALTLPGNSASMSWSTGDGTWHQVQVSGQVLGVSDSGIYVFGGSHLLLVSWSDPTLELRDLGIPPEPASRMCEWNGKPTFAGAHGLWVLDADGWALRRSPAPASIGTVNANLLLSDPTGSLWSGTLE